MEKTIKMSLSIQEINLLKVIKNIHHGQLKINVQDSNPIRVEEYIKTVNLQ